MTKSQYELIIIGAGVVGMGAALAAHKKGIKKIIKTYELILSKYI